MAFRATRVRPYWWLILTLCLFLFFFSLQAKLELYGRGLQNTAHPCNSSKLCLDAHTPKLILPRTILARIAISQDHRPTLRSEPMKETTLFVDVPRALTQGYQSRSHRSPPISQS